jgi:hypothetical protein
MTNDKTLLGKVSLWTSIVGLVVPVIIVTLLVTWILLFFKPGPRGWSHEDVARITALLAVSGVLFVVCELAALGCGIAARRTTTGKIGLVISGVLLTLALGLTVFVFMH